MWFEDNRKYDERAAREICYRCPVNVECLDWALDNEEYGMWGGVAARDRARMRRNAKRPLKQTVVLPIWEICGR